MKTSTVTIGIPDGLNADVIPLCVQTATKFTSETTINLIDGSRKINARSLIGLMSLGLTYEDNVTIVTNGPEEDAALEAMTAFFTEAK